MRESGFPFWPVVASGGTAAAFGIALLARPDAGVRVVTAIVGVQALAWILAVAWALFGLCGAVIAARVPGAARVGFAALAATSVLVGVALWMWPHSSAVVLVFQTGIGALAVGVWLIVVAVQLRQLSQED